MDSGEETTSHSIFSRNGSNSREFLELVNCLHEGLASLQVLGSVKQFYIYFVLRNQWHQHIKTGLIKVIMWLLLYH